MSTKILNFLLIAYLLVLKEVFSFDEDANKAMNSHFQEEIQRIRDMYKSNPSQPSITERNIELFLPKFDYQRPEKFRKEAYNKIYRHASKKPEALKDTFIFPENIIEENESQRRREILDSLIKKEVSMEDFSYGGNYEIYGFPDAKHFENNEPKYVNSEDPNIKIRNFQEISQFISFDPKELQINEKPLCIPTMTLLNLKNTMNENLILRSIKSDLYQVTIFYFRPGKDSNQSYNQKNVYPKTLQPGEVMIFQLIILPDMTGSIKGNIYLEFNDNKVVVYPLVINAVENIYRVNPIYSPNWLGSKLLQTPISIHNPHSKTLIVKEVINSFSSINLVWPNGQPVSSNHTSISSSMLEIPPKTTKNLMMINFYKEVPGVEYGLLQMKTDKDTLIIPVLIRVEIQGFKIFPNYFNFGLIDLNKNIKRLIPISLSNVSKQPLQVKTLYTTFEENLLEFIPNSLNTNCPSIIKNSQSGNINPLIGFTNVNQYNANFCVLSPGENLINFGYLMLDPNNYQPEINDPHLYKKIKGSIILQTNFTENPFMELSYEYYLDKNTFITNNNENSNNLFYETNSPSAKASYKYEINLKIKPPFTFNIQSLRNYLESESKTNPLKDLDRINIIPESNSISATFKEMNDTLKLNIVLDNPTTFINKKNYYFAVKTNLNLVSLIPVRFYDKSIDLHFCENVSTYKECETENYSIYKSINFKSNILNVDFGMISTSEVGKRYFSILNENSEKENLSILDVETSKANLVLGIESVEDIYTNEKITGTVSKSSQKWENGKLQKALRKKISTNNTKEKIRKIPIALPGSTYTTFSINLNSNSEGEFSGSIFLHFKDNVKLTVYVTAKFLKGNLNISPSVIRFEPAFPGFYQSKLVSSKSSYNIPISIHSVKSNDQRIIPTLLTHSIISNNRTEILKVTFDPSKVALEENFMKGGEYFLNSTSKYLTYKELYLWKEKQKLWELLGSQGRTEINTSVNIKTSIQSETVSVRAFLTKPSLVKKDEIDFGLIQIGETQSSYIEIFNPSDEPMVIQVLLASEEFADIYNNTMFTRNKKFRFSTENGVTLMECHFFNNTNFDLINSNFTQNQIQSQNKIKRSKKKKYEDDMGANIGFDPSNSIIIEEDLNHFKSMTKTDLLKKLFLYANTNIKNNFVLTERMICNSNFMNKNEIILNNYKQLTEKIFSDEFSKEINVIKRMTECNPPMNKKKEGRDSNVGLFEKIAQLLKIFFKTETVRKKRVSDPDRLRQDFYLPKIVSSQLHNLKPHQKLRIGPIIFNPSSLSNNAATLFIKNNLTMLYPIKLKGNGGSGRLNFSIFDDIYDPVTNSTIKREIPIRDNKLLFKIDSFEILNHNANEVITKTLLLKNTGNLPVKIANISIENSSCEANGIKLHKCEAIHLKPEETFKMQISVKPDFNFYFIEKDIIFETQQKSVILKISINISTDLLSYKNRLFNTDYLKNYGYVSVFVVMFIVSVILYILSVEYAEISNISNKSPPSLNFISSKEIIESSTTLKFENLFIKAYRKFNQGFYDDFVNKQFDKPGLGSTEIDNLGDKRKSTNKIPRERRSEDMKDSTEKKEEKLTEDKKMNVNMIDTVSKDQAKSSVPYKKETPTVSKVKKDSKRTATTTKKPIGLGKKEETTVVNDNLINTGDKSYTTGVGLNKKTAIGAEYTNPPNKFDHFAQNNTNTKFTQANAQRDYFNKDEFSNIPANATITTPYDPQNYHYDPNAPALSDNSVYAQGYWPKQYGNYYNKTAHVHRGFEPGVYNAAQGVRGGPYPNTGAYYPTATAGYYNPYTKTYEPSQASTSFKSANTVQVNKSEITGMSNIINTENLQAKPSESQKIEVQSNLISNFTKLNYPIDNKSQTNEEKESLSQQKESTPSTVNNLKEQFLAFAPDFFIKREDTNTNANEIPSQINVDQEKKETSSMENTEVNFNLPESFKSNFDFSNIFVNKPQPEPEVEQVLNNPDASEVDENKNFNEEDESSQHYQSEKEKFIDSGTEDFKFNFNSIFNQNNMKFTMNYDNEYTDNEEVQPSDGNKPYFDKNLFFSFDSTFNKPNLFTNDPFAAGNNKKSLLSELRDDDVKVNESENDRWEEKNNKLDKLDDVAENEDEDDEEDPLWMDDNFDSKKEGFFDETGTFKLKQMDFNFDYDFNKSKKL
jgi:hypothetical protein